MKLHPKWFKLEMKIHQHTGYIYYTLCNGEIEGIGHKRAMRASRKLFREILAMLPPEPPKESA